MNSFRLGIATADGISVCDHLARSMAFISVPQGGLAGADQGEATDWDVTTPPLSRLGSTALR